MIVPTQLRIARLAATPAVHRAFHWLHLHQPQLRRWHLEIVRIPAPPFGEQARAAWFLDRFTQLGLANPHIDAAGNVLAELPAAPHPTTDKVILLSAHLDTVFPANTPTEPTEHDTRILAPGACDNAAGLSALLGLAAALRHAELAPAVPILFAANVGEEGEGDLRGMRHLFTASPYGSTDQAPRIAAALALEGSGSSAVVTRALASRRFRVTVTGPGGHAWTDAGAPNPILILARALLALEALPSLAASAGSARTTLNIGQISGGTSINSIPESASASIDLRSTDPAELHSAEAALRSTLKHWVLEVPPSNLRATHPSPPHRDVWDPQIPASPPPTLTIDTIGDRPGGCLPDDSQLLTTLRAVDRHLNLRTEPGLGSTDANIPLSLGIPAIAIGAGGLGGGIHTLQEWYDPTGRNAALRRILLTLLDTAHLAAASSAQNP
jgi:acetylornithine deacetylase/succinyl-diaminopimelate desuccinylase-like protein